MTAYFDDLTREVSGIHGLENMLDFEKRVFDTLSMCVGDREFPDKLRKEAMGLYAKHAIFPVPSLPDMVNPEPRDYWDIMGLSRLVQELHSFFHTLAGKRIRTRFGYLTDDPSGITRSRDAHDSPKDSHDTQNL